MRLRPSTIAALSLLVAIALTCGCKKAAEPVTTPPPPTPQAPEAPAPAAPEPTQEVAEPFPTESVASAPIVEPSVDELNRSGVLRTVYFDYDRSDLGDETRATLQANADWLKANPKRTVGIEGHCDERGTVEYNLALGQRRAAAVKDYLVGLGIAGDRLRTVSYGKERPADLAHDAGAWAKNRRAEFRIES